MSALKPSCHTDKLIAANEANYLSYIRTFSAVTGNQLYESNATLLVLSNENGISMINNCVAKAPITEKNVAETLQRYKKANKPVLWTVFPSENHENAVKILKKNRVVHLEQNSLMYLDLSTLNESVDTFGTIHIKAVETSVELKEWAKLNALSFYMTRDTRNFITQKATPLFLKRSLPARHYIAYEKSRPVGTASVFLSDGVAGIYNVTAAPEARGKGIGEMITRKALLFGKKSGYKYATLQATEMGAPVYKKIGFHTDNQMDFYVKFHGSSRFLIPANNVFLSLENYFRNLFLN